eukprot:297847-Pleurochrysis_carterae.AAC.1
MKLIKDNQGTADIESRRYVRVKHYKEPKCTLGRYSLSCLSSLKGTNEMERSEGIRQHIERLGFQQPPVSEPSIRLLPRDVHYHVTQREE